MNITQLLLKEILDIMVETKTQTVTIYDNERVFKFNSADTMVEALNKLKQMVYC